MCSTSGSFLENIIGGVGWGGGGGGGDQES